MRKPKINMIINKEDVGYSANAYIKPYSINTHGDTFEELQDMIMDAVNLAFEEEGFSYTIDEIKFTIDLESFFAFYKVINAKVLSKRIGMNQSLLAQYIKGIKKPSVAQARRIMEGVQQIGRELSEINLLEAMSSAELSNLEKANPKPLGQ